MLENNSFAAAVTHLKLRKGRKEGGRKQDRDWIIEQLMRLCALLKLTSDISKVR